LGCTGEGPFKVGDDGKSSLLPFHSVAARVEVSPTTVSKKTKQEQVLIASVYDEDGSPLSRRKIEWTLEGPGTIVAADDGGLVLDRGKIDEGKYATSTTHSFEKKVDRKTKNPDDNFTVKAGQSWVVISSTVEGQSVVTATCPDVPDRAKGRVSAKVLWADSDYGFPPPAAVKAGGEHTLATTVNRNSAQSLPTGIKVRYRILGGAPAALVGTSGDGATLAQSGTNPQEIVAATDVNGSAGVRLVQAAPVAGKTRVGVEILKSDPAGVGPGTVVSRSETTVEWAAANLSLDIVAPPVAAEGRDAVYSVVLANGGSVDSSPVTVRSPIPDGATFVSADPPPTLRDGSALIWSAGVVPGGKKREFKVTVKPAKKGTLTAIASAETGDGMKAEQRATTKIDTAAIRVKLDVPAQLGTGEKATAHITATNPGGIPAENVTAWVTAGGGLLTGTEPRELAVGTIAAGGSRTIDVPLSAVDAGRFAVRASLTADGGLGDKTEVAVEVHKAGLKVEIVGPAKLPIGEEATFDVRLTNLGDAAVTNAAVRVDLPRGVRAVAASAGGQSTGATAGWKYTSLPPNGKAAVTLTVVADDAVPHGELTAKATASPGPGRTVESSAEAAVVASGSPALGLELAGPAKPVAVNGTGQFKVTLRNSGAGPAGPVDAVVELPAELAPVRGFDSTGKLPIARIDGQSVIFSALPQVPANGSLTLVVEVRGVSRGSATVRASVSAPSLTNPLREEQATRVVGGQ
jgi:uncharacterized repeat protein (TIGR01451 family)